MRHGKLFALVIVEDERVKVLLAHSREDRGDLGERRARTQAAGPTHDALLTQPPRLGHDRSKKIVHRTQSAVSDFEVSSPLMRFPRPSAMLGLRACRRF